MNTRQKDILALVEKRGEITIRELSEHFSVSTMTIHRDLEHLEEQRYLFKKRGAAVFVEQTDRNDGDFYAEEKRAIGIAVAKMIKHGQSIIFDNSTTALECAKYMDLSMRCTFYTTSIETATVLSKFKNSVLYCSGGYFFPETRGFIGTQAEQFVSSLKADVCIIGFSGISLEGGLTGPYPMHTELEKKIIASAKKRIVVADHSKFGRVALEKVAELSDIDVIVTDSGLSDELYEQYRDHVNIIKV